MDWTTEGIERLGDALDESTIFGLTADLEARVCRLLLEVDALPETGPLDPDPRRQLYLSEVSSIEILLREELFSADVPYGSAITLPSLDALNAFFGSLTMADSMYGCRFVDDEDAKAGWPDAVSLGIVLDRTPAPHQLSWFTECKAPRTATESASFLLEGVIRFRDAAVARADGSAMTVAQLADDANRWWRAFRAGDPRVSVEAQRPSANTARSWRPDWVGGSTTYIPGRPVNCWLWGFTPDNGRKPHTQQGHACSSSRTWRFQSLLSARQPSSVRPRFQ